MEAEIGLLSGLDHFPGFDAGCAHAEPLHALAHEGTNRLKVWLEDALCPVVCVAD